MYKILKGRIRIRTCFLACFFGVIFFFTGFTVKAAEEGEEIPLQESSTGKDESEAAQQGSLLDFFNPGRLIYDSSTRKLGEAENQILGIGIERDFSLTKKELEEAQQEYMAASLDAVNLDLDAFLLPGQRAGLVKSSFSVYTVLFQLKMLKGYDIARLALIEEKAEREHGQMEQKTPKEIQIQKQIRAISKNYMQSMEKIEDFLPVFFISYLELHRLRDIKTFPRAMQYAPEMLESQIETFNKAEALNTKRMQFVLTEDEIALYSMVESERYMRQIELFLRQYAGLYRRELSAIPAKERKDFQNRQNATQLVETAKKE